MENADSKCKYIVKQIRKIVEIFFVKLDIRYLSIRINLGDKTDYAFLVIYCAILIYLVPTFFQIISEGQFFEDVSYFQFGGSKLAGKDLMVCQDSGTCKSFLDILYERWLTTEILALILLALTILATIKAIRTSFLRLNG